MKLYLSIGTALLVLLICFSVAPTLRAETLVLTAEGIFARVVQANKHQEETMKAFSVWRTYTISQGQTVTAFSRVCMDFIPPGSKKFLVISETGSNKYIQLLENTEVRTAQSPAKTEGAFTPANYRLKLMGTELCDCRECYKMQVTPIGKKKRYLFTGWVWVLKDEFLVIRAEGSPAVLPSFWLSAASFVRTYKLVGGFWLPKEDRLLAKLKFIGREYAVTVTHDEYCFN